MSKKNDTTLKNALARIQALEIELNANAITYYKHIADLTSELRSKEESLRRMSKDLDEEKIKTELTYYVKQQLQQAMHGLQSLGF